MSWLRRGDVLEMTWGLTAGCWIAVNCFRWSSLLDDIFLAFNAHLRRQKHPDVACYLIRARNLLFTPLKTKSVQEKTFNVVAQRLGTAGYLWKKGLLPLDTCCKHCTRSRCWGTGWPKAGRKWSSRKSSSGPPATQLTNPQLLRYNRKSCTGQQVSSWAVSLVKPIQRWKINAHTRGFAGATLPALQFFLPIYLCKSRFCLERTVKLNLAWLNMFLD